MRLSGTFRSRRAPRSLRALCAAQPSATQPSPGGGARVLARAARRRAEQRARTRQERQKVCFRLRGALPHPRTTPCQLYRYTELSLAAQRPALQSEAARTQALGGMLRLQQSLTALEHAHAEKDAKIKNLKQTLHQIQITMLDNEEVLMATKHENARLRVRRHHSVPTRADALVCDHL